MRLHFYFESASLIPRTLTLRKKYYPELIWNVVCGDCELRGASLQWIASFHSHRGLSKNANISVSFFSVCFMEQKIFAFDFLFLFSCMTRRVELFIIISFKIKCFWQITWFSRTIQGASTRNFYEKIFWKAQTWSYRWECLLLNRILCKIKVLFCRAVVQTVFMLKLFLAYVNKNADESKSVLYVIVL